ncbi:DUF6516 family protein [Halococcus sp. IIIV-5B]|uniref:toxin-antitoxin system TumE family protein n=1 Tax=Halococcus sp. IIIV-5B TaxID=2321230 RepID=UPI000E70CDE6|nr:DUF6516 family protein [Halococcus sp. IIIV-5B]RJT04707.1 hypothetical protein D3261_08850 [Halococcus sp. IIIV-5B]
MALTPTNLDGYSRTDVYEDDTLVRVSVRRTEDAAYPSSWRYTLHYGALVPNPPKTLEDGTIRRYDNSHEDTKGHELHTTDQPTGTIQFPGMVELYERFWSEIPKPRFEPSENGGRSA